MSKIDFCSDNIRTEWTLLLFSPQITQITQISFSLVNNGGIGADE